MSSSPAATALARTHLPAARLSEDVDLYTEERLEVARRLAEGLPTALRREFPGLRWDPPPDTLREPGAGLLVPPTGLGVRVQVLSAAGYHPWPAERRTVDMRYSDVPPAELVVPTRTAFVAMKASAWFDRHTARDLYDLWALARAGAVDEAAAELFRDAVGWWPKSSTLFGRGPADDWFSALGHQTADLPGLDEALSVVREAFRSLDRA